MVDPSPTSYNTYKEFWPFYLGEHAQNTTRRLHLLGTALAILAMIAAVFTLKPAWIVVALIAGYGFAWYAHAFVEKNRPATFTHPLWSMRADFHMFWLFVTARLDDELVKYKVLR